MAKEDLTKGFFEKDIRYFLRTKGFFEKDIRYFLRRNWRELALVCLGVVAIIAIPGCEATKILELDNTGRESHPYTQTIDIELYPEVPAPTAIPTPTNEAIRDTAEPNTSPTPKPEEPTPTPTPNPEDLLLDVVRNLSFVRALNINNKVEFFVGCIPVIGEETGNDVNEGEAINDVDEGEAGNDCTDVNEVRVALAVLPRDRWQNDPHVLGYLAYMDQNNNKITTAQIPISRSSDANKGDDYNPWYEVNFTRYYDVVTNENGEIFLAINGIGPVARLVIDSAGKVSWVSINDGMMDVESVIGFITTIEENSLVKGIELHSFVKEAKRNLEADPATGEYRAKYRAKYIVKDPNGKYIVEDPNGKYIVEENYDKDLKKLIIVTGFEGTEIDRAIVDFGSLLDIISQYNPNIPDEYNKIFESAENIYNEKKGIIDSQLKDSQLPAFDEVLGLVRAWIEGEQVIIFSAYPFEEDQNRNNWRASNTAVLPPVDENLGMWIIVIDPTKIKSSDDYLITTLHELARIIAQINYDDQRGIKPLAIQLFMQAVLAADDPNGNTLGNPFTYIDIETFLGEAKEDLSK